VVGVGKRSFQQETEVYVFSIIERVKDGIKAIRELENGYKI